MRRFGIACGWAVAGLTVLYLLLPVVVIGEAGRARRATAHAQIAAFQQAVEGYRQDIGEYPTEASGLSALRVNPGVPNWNGPYLSVDVPVDPWGMPYRYRLRDGHPEITDSQAAPVRGTR